MKKIYRALIFSWVALSFLVVRAEVTTIPTAPSISGFTEGPHSQDNAGTKFGSISNVNSTSSSPTLSGASSTAGFAKASTLRELLLKLGPLGVDEKKLVESDVMVSPKTFQNDQGLWDLETIKAFLFASASKLGLPMRPDPERPTVAVTPAVVFFSAEGNSFKSCQTCQQEMEEFQKRLDKTLAVRGFSTEWKFPSQGLPKEYFENSKDAFEWAQGHDFVALFWVRLTPDSDYNPSQFSGKISFLTTGRSASVEFSPIVPSALGTAISRSMGLSLAQASGFSRSQNYALTTSTRPEEDPEEFGTVGSGDFRQVQEVNEKLFSVTGMRSGEDFEAALEKWNKKVQEKAGAQARVLPRMFEENKATFVFYRVPADFSVREFLQSQTTLKGGRAPASEGITERAPVYEFVPEKKSQEEQRE